MNNVIFWIIVCSWLIPMGIRMYNRSRMRRTRAGEFEDHGYRSFPGNPSGPYNPGQHDEGPHAPGHDDPRPYDPSRYPPGQYSPKPYPTTYSPEQPSVVFPTEPQPPASRPTAATPAPQAAPPSSSVHLPGTSSQGYRARKLAELDQQYSDGKIAMEDYMKLRQEIMNG